MAVFLFEFMSQTQANAATVEDIIAFSNTMVSARDVTVTISAAGDTIRITRLAVNGKTLDFDSQTISDISENDNLVFNDNSTLRLGTNSSEVANDFDPSATYPNTIYGFAGNDVIEPLGGNDFVFGGNGADTVIGNAGNEHIYGFGLTGDPTGDGGDSLTGAGGNDYLQGNAGADAIDGGIGNDRILGGSGNDSVTGGAGQDTINGNLGNDLLDGGMGEDSIRGGQGNDSLVGAAGNDILLGDLGDDTLSGGAGVDNLTGGAGSDLFTFAGGEASGYDTSGSFEFFTDCIFDFVQGTDKISLVSATGIVGDTSNEIVYGDIGANFTTVRGARAYAQLLLKDNVQANDVAIIKVGNDTYLFYDSTGVQGADVNSIVKIANVTDPSLFTSADFGI